MNIPIALIILLLSFPVGPPGYVRPLDSYPAVVTFYAPERGGRNCDDDCTTTATGLVEEANYGLHMACHQDLLGLYVTFEGIGTWRCMDNGDDITILWSPHHGRHVLFFDALLHEEPSWNFARWDPEYWCITEEDITGQYDGLCPDHWYSIYSPNSAAAAQ